MFDRRLLTHFDWVLLLVVVTVAGIGILNLYSATSIWATPGPPSISNRSTGSAWG